MIVTRFAPSPTGRLHLGHAHSAAFAHDAARAGGGRFTLRVEDIDTGRCRPEFAAGIEEDLAWLGLTWDGPVWHQSARFPAYRAALDGLAARELVYPCFCTRKEIEAEIAAAGGAPHGPDGPVYPGTCRALSRDERQARIAAGIPHALRLDMGRATATTGPLAWHDRRRGTIQARPERFGDIVLARKDAPASYHLAVTIDDAAQGITLVTRGEDLVPATDIHRLLQALLDLPVPDHEHHGLLTDASGRRYAKRDQALTLQALREVGHRPAEVLAMARGDRPVPAVPLTG